MAYFLKIFCEKLAFWLKGIYLCIMKERKTIKVISASGKEYYRRPYVPTPPPRRQRYTMLRNLAVIRLVLTPEEYSQVKEAENAIGRAGGANVTLTTPDIIIGAVQASLRVLQGNTLNIAGSTYAPMKKAPGRPAHTCKGHVVVMLNVSEDIPLRLSKYYDKYCELEGVEAFPASGPIWAAFRHGVRVIKEALGECECKCIRFMGGGRWHPNGCKIHPNG